MESLEKRLAERNLRRKEGPGPVVIAPVDPSELPQDLDDEEFPARVINKGPGSSKEPKNFVQRVEGSDSIDNGVTPTVAAENGKANTEAAIKSGPAAGGGGGAKDWKPSK